MIRNYIKIAIRNIFKQKVYSFINILGLAIGFAAFSLIALYVQYELSFDRYHKHANRVYRIVREEYANTPPPIAPILTKEFPEVLAATRIIRSKNTLFSHEDKFFEEKEYYWADPDAIEIFSISFINGNPKQALYDPNTIILSEKTATKYFGNEDPLGKILTIDGEYDYTVSGVFENMPANSHFRMNAIIAAKKFFEVSGNSEESWGGHYLQTYFLLHKDANPKLLEEKFNPVFEEYVHNRHSQMDYKSFMIQPITEIHLYSHRQQEMEANGDIKHIILFSIIAFLILIIACINYMNLAASQIIKRSTEIKLRKAIGANRRQLLTQFFGETFVITFLAAIFSMILIIIILPSFNNLVGRELSITSINNSYLVIIVFSIVLFSSLLSGFFPAFYITKLKPCNNISNIITKDTSRMTLRNALVLIQFSITIMLIICTLIVKQQLYFIKDLDMGFSREQIINLQVIDKSVRENIELIKAELDKNSDITAVSTSVQLPNNIIFFNRPGWLNENREEPMAIYYNSVSCDYVNVFDIDIVEGRNFSKDFASDKNGAFLINEAAAKATGWESVIGKEIYFWSGVSGPIVGVMKDFHLQSVHSPIVPVYFLLNEQTYSNLSIKFNTSRIKEAIDFVESVFKEVSPNTPFNYTFFDDEFEQAYEAENRLAKLFSLFSYLGIIIACLGLLGLTTNATIRREKEIAIRKALGASVSSITLLLSREFFRLVILANIVSWPVAYYFLNKWLKSFAYQTTISWWTFVLSGVMALLIALITISFHTIKAANKNPVASLH